MVHFPNFGCKLNFLENWLSSATSYGFLVLCQNLEKANVIQFQENTERQDPWKDGRTDRSYFIGFFWLLPAVPQIHLSYFELIVTTNSSNSLKYKVCFGLCLSNKGKYRFWAKLTWTECLWCGDSSIEIIKLIMQNQVLRRGTLLFFFKVNIFLILYEQIFKSSLTKEESSKNYNKWYIKLYQYQLVTNWKFTCLIKLWTVKKFKNETLKCFDFHDIKHYFVI